ncbi:HNH family homing endonuclease [Pectobacterium phage PP16]|uniref:HNH family homing endonuclease n=1 Tax=Pectobacterium phage PP16 TaxID=1873958 RepID=A0A1B1PEB9_9CAUD|nr:HNH family homing endonuclease [Pectobacterium phage PP16]ANT45317.1 HNH family homing endonuclease [Pectobacterium phage PP16]
MEIRDVIAYDPTSPTGLRWLVATSNRVKVGSPAIRAKHSGGYYSGMVLGARHYAHRVVWYLHTGYWPEQVDHINGKRNANRIENLREVTNQQNSFNRKDVKGYIPYRGKYMAYITIDYKFKFLGYHDTPEAAREAHLKAKKLLHIFEDGNP